MSTWSRVADPRARRARSWVLDVLVTVVVLLIGLAGRANSPVDTLLTYAVVVGLTAPLLVRRIWPVQAFLAQLAVAAAAGWWAGDQVVSLALVVGLYTVAALKSRRDAFVAAGLLEIGVVAASARIYADDATWWAPAIAFTGVLVAALALGLYVGTRRTLLAQLRERAEQLERERDQQGELAAAAERSRIAREMHDIVAHHLTVMVALSDGAVAASAKSPERAVEVMRTVSATGRQALSDTRRLLGVLRDDAEGGGGERRPLPDLSDLDELLHRVRDAGLPVRYEVNGTTPEIAPAVQLTVYRLVQEALTNTMKHAGDGASATVSLHYAPDEVRVDVRDDGGRRTSPPVTGIGRGLAGMRERVTAFGGEVWTGPVDGHGWRVAATMRLQESAS